MNEVSIDERIRNLPRPLRAMLSGKAVATIKASASNTLTEKEVDVLLKDNGVTDVQERLAAKISLEAAGIMVSTPVRRVQG
jgi:hypothetical protein